MLLRMFGIFSVIAIIPVVATSLTLGFINFDYEMLNPQMWSTAARGLCAAWIVFIYGVYFVLWIRLQIEFT